MPCLPLSHSMRDVHAAAKLARPLVQRQDPPFPYLSIIIWTLSCIIHTECAFSWFWTPNLQCPIPFRGKAQVPYLPGQNERRNATQGGAFKTALAKRSASGSFGSISLGRSGGEASFGLSYAEHAVVGPLSASA